MLTNVFTGRPARGIQNRLVREVGPLSVDAPAFPYATAGTAPLRAAAEALGSGEFSPLWAGQAAPWRARSPPPRSYVGWSVGGQSAGRSRLTTLPLALRGSVSMTTISRGTL